MLFVQGTVDIIGLFPTGVKSRGAGGGGRTVDDCGRYGGRKKAAQFFSFGGVNSLDKSVLSAIIIMLFAAVLESADRHV